MFKLLSVLTLTLFFFFPPLMIIKCFLVVLERVFWVFYQHRGAKHTTQGEFYFCPGRRPAGVMVEVRLQCVNVALRSRLDQNRNVGTFTTRANMTVLLPGIKTFSAILKILSTCPLRICNNTLLADGNQHHVFGMSVWTVNFLQ